MRVEVKSGLKKTKCSWPAVNSLIKTRLEGNPCNIIAFLPRSAGRQRSCAGRFIGSLTEIRESYELALSVLKQHRIPADFFPRFAGICTAPIKAAFAARERGLSCKSRFSQFALSGYVKVTEILVEKSGGSKPACHAIVVFSQSAPL